MSLRDTILSANDISVSPVEVPEWGCTVYVRTWSEADAMKVKRAGKTGGDDADVVLVSACDQDAKPLFTEEDLPALRQKSAVVIGRIAMAAVKHQGIGPDTDMD